MIKFKTERLVLRGWQPSDYAPFARINADQEVMKYFPAPLSKVESDANADVIGGLIDKRGWGFWAVEIPDICPFTGFVGLHIPIAELPFSPCVEIGWRLDKEFWGYGYATEAARFALEYGFTKLDLDEIVSFTAKQNKASQAVMKRLGMSRESETFEHPSIPVGNSLREHFLYRLQRNAWIEMQCS
ncbi:GNAT family N-acetyltransferase [Maridesulfovibrio salexigens]|uniref:GCN5-related N-acetyltransferase n=1 Tax=Maridesulfovibrio salexigens (strain ATCC 14822 / DSM 2638 / NCIMB 8403 / VKM B-1763) TaxID=526222 RepID=C6BSH2_MARSD|nr:GNAT family N-acetyltransferase [Maridesulfovibrio salexigens]ACS79648.1 GCN5-related N-acetyltransferase [Maridesulfovibrio salexigens DSM 2638]